MTLPLRGLRVLVSGAGVAGPVAAYWLAHHGADVTVVEIAPTLRTGGFAVDFRGPTHLDVLSRTGVLDELRRLQTHGGAMSCVDAYDREIFRLPAEFAGGDLEVRRRDLSRVLVARAADTVDYVFGNRITAMVDAPDGVRVDLAQGASRTFDLVVGADGVHSGVRQLTFGDHSRYVHHLGYQIAGWDLPNERGFDRVPRQYNVPGRMASVSADQDDPARASAMVVFTNPRPGIDWRDTERQKQLITDRFAGLGWHVPYLLGTLPQAQELYFDSISRVRVPAWHSGRTALLGDAAWGVTLGGMGVGTGLVGGYVLAGELASAAGDHRVAFPAYEQRMRRYAAAWQRGANAGRFLAPASAAGLWLRNTLFATRLVQRMLVSGSGAIATTSDLPAYPTTPTTS